jgi:cytochrome c-type biogenesis protein CcsB
MYFINDYLLPLFSSFFLFFAMILYWISLSIVNNKIINLISKILIFLSNLFFGATLCIRWLKNGYFPLSNLYESLIFLAWSISFFLILLEYKTKSRLIGSIILPVIFFLSFFASLTLPIDMQKSLSLVPSLQSNWLMMHVSMMMLSYALLIIGSLLSIIYLFFLMFKQKNNFILEILDLWSYRIICFGFPFLTLGILSGAVWANEAWGSYWSWDPKETWALITWLVFASYLHSRLVKGWNPKSASILATFGFLILWVCYLGVNFLGKGLHSYGWIF